jgi:hypothetical protein
MPAHTPDTTPGTSDKAELHMIRAVNTGIINVSYSWLLDISGSLKTFDNVVILSDTGVSRQITATEGFT